MPVTLIPFFSSLARGEASAAVLARLASSGVQVTSPADFLQKAPKRSPSRADNHQYVFVGTGGTEKSIADFLSKARLQPPILLLSHERDNSLPAAMETRTYLQERGVGALIIHVPLDRLVERLREWCVYARVEDRIRASRIGLIGKPSRWLVGSHVSPAKVRRRWGVAIQKYPLAALVDQIGEHLAPDSKTSLEQFITRAEKMSVPRDELTWAAAVAQALARFIRAEKLDAVTVECFRLLEHTGITGCYAMSRLNDSSEVAAGCEGDVPATFTMLLAKLLTGQLGFMANVADVDLESNSAVFAHCTIPTSMVDEYEVTTHFESARSIAIQGCVRAEPVTVLKVFGEDLSRHWASSGVVVSHKGPANGCRTQVRVKLAEPVRYFLEQSLANHHIVVSGNHVKMLSDFFAFVLRE